MKTILAFSALVLLTIPKASLSQCPHRVVPESWDRDKSTLNYDDIHVFVFGGSKGMRVSGTCEPGIAKWKDDINLHQNCKIVGIREVQSDGLLGNDVGAGGFYFNRDKTGDRASLTFLKATTTDLVMDVTFYEGKTLQANIENCGGSVKSGCLVFRVEAATDGQVCPANNGTDGGTNGGTGGGTDGGTGGGTDGGTGGGTDGGTGGGTDGGTGGGTDGGTGGGTDGGTGGGTDGGTGGGTDGGTGGETDGNGNTNGNPDSGSRSDAVNADENNDNSSDAIPVALPLAVIAIAGAIVLAVIAAVVVLLVKRRRSPSASVKTPPSSSDAFDNQMYDHIQGRPLPNPEMSNPMYQMVQEEELYQEV